MCRPETKGQSSGNVTPIRRQHLRCIMDSEHWPRHAGWEVQQWIDEMADYLKTLGGTAPAMTSEAGHVEVMLWLNAALDMVDDIEPDVTDG